MSKLKEIYADSDIIIRTKAPQLRAVLLLGTGFLPLIIVSDFIAGDLVASIMETIMFVTLGLSIVSLYRGRYRLASMIPLTLTTAAIVGVAVLIVPESRQHVQSVALYMVVPVVISLVISENEWYTLAMAIVGLLTILGVSFLKIAPALPALGDNEPIMEEVVVAGVIHILISVFAIIVSRSNRLAMQAVDASSRQTEETLARIVDVSREAQSSLDTSKSAASDYESVHSSVQSITSQIAVVEERIANLRDNVSRALESVRSTSDRVLGFHEQVDEQNTVVQESTSSVNQMSVSLDSVASITASKREANEHLQEVVEDGRQALESTNMAFQTASREMESLLEINQIISDIASQTNLLSMNAAIEASHAGDAGRGFAVVAEEIRKLAGSTSQNSQVIAENVKRLMDSIQATSSYVQATTEAMTRISGEVRSAAEAFDEITGSSAELSQGGREIMKAMQLLQDSSISVRDGSDGIAREQKSVRDEIETVGDTVTAIETAIGEVARAIGAIGEAMDHLRETISASHEESDRLHQSISELSSGLRRS